MCLRKDRLKRRGGGVCVFVKHELNAKRIDVQSTMHLTEDLWFRVTLAVGLVINICACYHPKPVYDSAAFRDLLFDNISGLFDDDRRVYSFLLETSIS